MSVFRLVSISAWLKFCSSATAPLVSSWCSSTRLLLDVATAVEVAPSSWMATLRAGCRVALRCAKNISEGVPTRAVSGARGRSSFVGARAARSSVRQVLELLKQCDWCRKPSNPWGGFLNQSTTNCIQVISFRQLVSRSREFREDDDQPSPFYFRPRALRKFNRGLRGGSAISRATAGGARAIRHAEYAGGLSESGKNADNR